MAVVVLLPSLLATEAGGRNRFEVEASSPREALRELPIRSLLFDEQSELRPLVNVYVDGVDVRNRGGLDETLSGGEEIRVVAAIAGGLNHGGTPGSPVSPLLASGGLLRGASGAGV
jgi:molybdopterin converting factor small subunit